MIQFAPQAISDALTKFAGRNEYDKTIWRCVVAETVTVMRGGVFVKWPSGDTTTVKLEKRLVSGKWDGTYIQHHTPIKPDESVEGVFEIPKYPVKGWIMERWFPPHVFGSKVDWESVKGFNSNLPLFGEFPSRGDYWMLGGPWEKCPALGDLECAIQMWESQLLLKPKDFEMWMKMALKHEQDTAEAETRRLEKEIEQFVKSEITPIFKSTSLEAQRVRNEVSPNHHLGAGQQ
jgi:hypothetical protein